MTDRALVHRLEYRLLIERMALCSAVNMIRGQNPDRAIDILEGALGRMTADCDAVQATRKTKRAA